jgi:hypothetical protein
MFPLSVRILLVTLCFSAATYRFYEGKESWPLYLFAGLFVSYEHLKGGSIWLAFQAYRKRKLVWVRRFLRNTYKPEWLRPSSKSYYFFLTAVINTIDGDLKNAKRNLSTAIKFPFSNEHMRCLAHCFLAEVYIDLGEKDKGKEFYEFACNITHRTELNPMIEKLGRRIEDLA